MAFGKIKRKDSVGTSIFDEPEEPDIVSELRDAISGLSVVNEQSSLRMEKATKELTKSVNTLNATMQRASRSRKW